MIFLVLIFLVFFITMLFIKPKCPDCNGNLYYEEYDVACDRDIYKCNNCGKEWI